MHALAGAHMPDLQGLSPVPREPENYHGARSRTVTEDARGTDAPAHPSSLLEDIEHIRRWVRQPSVSATGQGIPEMATIVRDDLLELGFSVSEYLGTEASPVVWGFLDQGAARTVAVYLMYDVQPVEGQNWKHSPFDASLVDLPVGLSLVGRGANNQKGPGRAFLNAVRHIVASDSELPVNLVVIADGEEEIGSPSLPRALEAIRSSIPPPTTAIFPHHCQGLDGRILLPLGVKGLLYVELSARGGAHGGPTKSPIHGSYKAIVDSPALRLIKAIGSLVDDSGNRVLFPGFYDAVHDSKPPPQTEYWDDRLRKEEMGVRRWIRDMSPNAAAASLGCSPCINLDGFRTGYVGPSMSTVVPEEAVAKIDFRLVPDQEPEAIARALTHHLSAGGFAEVAVRILAALPPADVLANSAEVRSVAKSLVTYGEVYTEPRLSGSAPFAWLTKLWQVPVIPVGVGYGTGSHGADEMMLIEPADELPVCGLEAVQHAYADILRALA